ncbi:MAG: F0F1 ATP synthase subunit delta [Clostridia bacterium]|nr:F0F1 ATP synthase subunit delta [Clostridia bacterium]
MKITITVPENSTDDFYEEICSGFRKRYGDDIQTVKRTSCSLIGGFTAEANGTVYDTSVSSKLNEIKKAIKG